MRFAARRPRGGPRGAAWPRVGLECLALACAAFAVQRGWCGDEAAAASDAEIAARVDGEPIGADEVRAILDEALGRRSVSEEARQALAAGALQTAIDRRLVANLLVKEKLFPTARQIDAALAELEARFQRRGGSLADFLQERGWQRETYRRLVAWRIGWRRCLAAKLTDEALSRYFAEHRREFDGSEVRVAHILLRPAAASAGQPPGKPQDEEVSKLEARAASLRRDILAGRVTFEAAAREHSAAPSREAGGDLGFISRRGQMPEAFARAAFALEVGEISSPVRTRYGVHLILCRDIREGDKSLADVRDEVYEAASLALFQTLARQARRTAKIEIVAGHSPAADRPQARQP